MYKYPYMRQRASSVCLFHMRDEERNWSSGVEKKKEADLCLVEQVRSSSLSFPPMLDLGLAETPTALHVREQMLYLHFVSLT